MHRVFSQIIQCQRQIFINIYPLFQLYCKFSQFFIIKYYYIITNYKQHYCMKNNTLAQQHISPQIKSYPATQLPFSPKQPSALSQPTKFESTQQKTGQHAQKQKTREEAPNRVIENISDFELYNRNVNEEIGLLLEDEAGCQLTITYCNCDEKVYEIRINGLESKVIQQIVEVLDLEKIDK